MTDWPTWQIGDVKVTQVREVMTPVDGAGLFVGFDPAVIAANAHWLRPHYVDDNGQLMLSIHALILESQGKRIVVDTCLGNHEIPGYEALSSRGSTFLADLADAGYGAETIDIVTCTHLHFDHVGWNTHLVDGTWVPTFDNARYLFGRVEYEYWDAGNEGFAITFDNAVQPVFEAGLAELVETDHRITDEVWFEATPGHTPGHVSVRISSQGHDAIITGDMIHHPVQFISTWGMTADDDPDAARATREGFKGVYGDTDVLVFGTHFGGSSCGHLVSDGDSWRFDSA